MEIMHDAAKKLGLSLSARTTSLSGIDESHSSSDIAIRMKSLLEGALPAQETTFSAYNNPPINDGSFPLTDIQYAYLIGKNPAMPLGGSPAIHYFEVEVFRPDIKKMNHALNQVIAYHPMTRAELTDGGRQRFSDRSDYVIQVQTYDENETTQATIDLRSSMITRCKLSENNQPLEVSATKKTNNKVVFHFCFDLMFFDLCSIKIFMRDLWGFYNMPDKSAKSPNVCFSQYLVHEKNLQASLQGEQDRIYWLKKMDELPTAPELPLQKSPELIKKPKTLSLSKNIPTSTVNKLREQAHRFGLTLETIFLGTYAEVIKKWSRKQTFTLTLTQHNRRSYFEEVSDIVGNFIQPCLLDVNSTASMSLSERFVELQTELILNRWHSSFNGIQVLRELTRRQNDGRAVSLPVVFSNTLDAELRDLVSDHLWEGSAQVVHTETHTPGIWLENQLLRINGELVMSWNYVEDLFPTGMVEAMFDAMLALLTTLASSSTIWKATDNIVPLPGKHQQARETANDTDRLIPDQLLHEPVILSAQRQPNAVAIIQGHREITYCQLVNTAYHVAEELHRHVNVKPNEVVAISMAQSPEMLAAILGVLISGAAYVSIDPSLPAQRKQKLLERCAAKAIIAEQQSASSPIHTLTVPLCTDDTNRTVNPTKRVQSLNDLAYVIFTSGSTGEPKGVMISHRNAANTVADINQRFNVGPTDRVFSVAPAGFDLSVYDYFGLLGAGGSILFAAKNDPADPQAWANYVLQQDVTIWNSVPAPVKALFERAGPQLKDSKLRLVLMSGDWMPVDLPGQIQKISEKINIISLGGATEGSIWSIVYPIKEVDTRWKSIPYGKPLANQRFHVLNEWLEHCPDWVTGELYIAGEGVAEGYLRDAEKTAARFFAHPVTGERLYRTGDLGRYMQDGLIEILGREDNQVKINGYRIELGEIEAALLTHPAARHVVIHAITHPKTQQKQLAAYIVASRTASIEEEMRAVAASSLPSYMVPTWFVILDTIPLTSNGKIDRNALPSVWAQSEADAEQNVPVDATEERLYSLWSAQLQHSDFGVTDGFFDIGGDSLHAVSLLSAVRKHFSITPTNEQDMIESLFMNASVRDFSRILAEVSLDAEGANS